MAFVKYILVLLLSVVLISSAAAENNDSSWSVLPSFVSKIYGDCERKDYELADCLKVKVVSLLDRASRSDVIELGESMTLVRESNRIDHGRALSENDIEGTLSGEGEKGTKLNTMIFDRVSKFLNSHSLKINFPKIDTSAFAKSLDEGNCIL